MAMGNNRLWGQTNPVLTPEEQRQTEKVILEAKKCDSVACKELYNLYKQGNAHAHDALVLEIRGENETVLQINHLLKKK